MIRTFLCKNKKVVKNLPLKEIKKYLKDKKATIWVDVQRGNQDDFNAIQETFGFDHLSMEDVSKSIELPKIDPYHKYLFIVMHSIAHNTHEKYPQKREIDFFLGHNFLVSLHIHESPSIEHLAQKLEKNHEGSDKRPDFLMYEIIDFFVDLYFPLIEYWDDKIEELEADIIAQRRLHTTLKEIMFIKRELLYLKKSIAPQRDVINKLSRRDFPFVCRMTSMYFRDVYDHIMRVYAELEIQRDILSGNFEAYTSVLSNRLSFISNKMNEIMKRLTIIATIFMPLTFFAGVYGMNFHYFPEITWRYGYYIFWVFCILIGIMMYIFFKKKRWA
jgi:magnesium transporter